MWRLAFPALALAQGVYEFMTDAGRPARRHTVLERNLQRLSQELRSSNRMKIGILGQPGAGKSLLLKKMTKNKVRPLPIIGAETDATNWAEQSGIELLSTYNRFVFVDVPGYDTAAHPIPVFREFFPFSGFDSFIFVVRGKLREADEAVFQLIAASGKPVCVCRSFAENCDEGEREAVSEDLQKRLHLADDHIIGFFSNRSGEGVADILEAVTQCSAAPRKSHGKRACATP